MRSLWSAEPKAPLWTAPPSHEGTRSPSCTAEVNYPGVLERGSPKRNLRFRTPRDSPKPLSFLAKVRRRRKI